MIQLRINQYNDQNKQTLLEAVKAGEMLIKTEYCKNHDCQNCTAKNPCRDLHDVAKYLERILE